MWSGCFSFRDPGSLSYFSACVVQDDAPYPHSSQQEGERGRGGLTPFLEGYNPKLYTLILLVPYWPELSHMATSNCKGGWEM